MAWVERPQDLGGLDLVVLPDGPTEESRAPGRADPGMAEGIREHMARGGYLVAIGSGRAIAESLGVSSFRRVLCRAGNGPLRSAFEDCLVRARMERGLPDPPDAARTAGESRPEGIAEVLRGCMDLGPIRVALRGVLA